MLVRDLVAGSDVLLRFWGRAEQWIRQPPVALAGITTAVRQLDLDDLEGTVK